MSEISNIFRELRGKRTFKELSKEIKVAEGTLVKVEAIGLWRGPIRISTLRTIMDKMKLPREKRAEITIAWVRSVLGEDTELLAMRPRSTEEGGTTDFHLNNLPREERDFVTSVINDDRLRKALMNIVAVSMNSIPKIKTQKEARP